MDSDGRVVKVMPLPLPPMPVVGRSPTIDMPEPEDMQEQESQEVQDFLDSTEEMNISMIAQERDPIILPPDAATMTLVEQILHYSKHSNTQYKKFGWIPEEEEVDLAQGMLPKDLSRIHRDVSITQKMHQILFAHLMFSQRTEHFLQRTERFYVCRNLSLMMKRRNGIFLKKLVMLPKYST